MMLEEFPGHELTIVILWTEPNHKAMSSWTILSALQDFVFPDCSITH